MALSARDKGKRGEREVINLLQPYVDEILGVGEVVLQRNTLQYDNGGCDITGLDMFAIEVKRVERLNVKAWWRQTLAQTKKRQTPVLFYRQNSKKWVIMYQPKDHAEPITTDFENFIKYFKDTLLKWVE